MSSYYIHVTNIILITPEASAGQLPNVFEKVYFQIPEFWKLTAVIGTIVYLVDMVDCPGQRYRQLVLGRCLIRDRKRQGYFSQLEQQKLVTVGTKPLTAYLLAPGIPSGYDDD